MAISVEDLLKPRYKVIADWPEMRERFMGNPTIVMNKQDEEGWYTTNGHYQQSFFEQYPHLFKSLSWWEERKPEDMPQYVKHKIDGLVGKITEQAKYTPSDVFVRSNGTEWFGWLTLYDCEPATEEEYLQSKQPKKNGRKDN